MTRPSVNPPSDITLERYRLGELPAEAMDAIATAARTDPHLRARLDQLDASTNDLRGHGVLRALETRVLAASSTPQQRWTRTLVPTMTAAAVLVALIVLVPGVMDSRHPDLPADHPESGDRVKGEPASLTVYRRVNDSSEQLTDGAPARKGDVIRVAYRTTQTFGVIVSVDGAGIVTRHFPADGPAAAALQPGAQTLLDSAYELDDAPRWERFFLVTSDAAFVVAPVVEAARRAASQTTVEPPATLMLPAGLEQVSFLLRKVQ